MTLKFVGKKYSGFDPITNMTIKAMNGEIIHASKEKEDQLLKDFPTQWTRVAESKAVKEIIKDVVPPVEPKSEPKPIEKEEPKKPEPITSQEPKDENPKFKGRSKLKPLHKVSKTSKRNK